MTGKDKCKILKDIRKKIADENDIPYITDECGFKGNCKGTCPKCESELRYLEKELEKRKNLGKKIAVAGLAASMVVALSGCDDFLVEHTAGDLEADPAITEEMEGEVAIEENYMEEGEVPDEECEVDVLEGDIAFEPSDTDEDIMGRLA